MSKNTHSVIYRFYGARKKTMNNISNRNVSSYFSKNFKWKNEILNFDIHFLIVLIIESNRIS